MISITRQTRTRVPREVTRVRNAVTGKITHIKKGNAMHRNDRNGDRGEAAVTLSHNPLMLITVYDLSEKFAIALANAIKTDDVSKLASLVTWDIENFLDDNGGVEEWLS